MLSRCQKKKHALHTMVDNNSRFRSRSRKESQPLSKLLYPRQMQHREQQHQQQHQHHHLHLSTTLQVVPQRRTIWFEPIRTCCLKVSSHLRSSVWHRTHFVHQCHLRLIQPFHPQPQPRPHPESHLHPQHRRPQPLRRCLPQQWQLL